MSIFFKVEGRKVVPNTETLLTPPFKEIWERDETEEKTYAIEDFTYIEFVSSELKTNPYKGYSENLRRSKVKEDIITRKDWEEDAVIKKAIDKVFEFQVEASPTLRYYLSAKKASEKMQDFFDNFDIREENPKTGNPIYKPRDITSALNDTSKVLENLNSLKEKVEQELFESTRTKGQKQISPFAEPDMI